MFGYAPIRFKIVAAPFFLPNHTRTTLCCTPCLSRLKTVLWHILALLLGLFWGSKSGCLVPRIDTDVEALSEEQLHRIFRSAGVSLVAGQENWMILPDAIQWAKPNAHKQPPILLQVIVTIKKCCSLKLGFATLATMDLLDGFYFPPWSFPPWFRMMESILEDWIHSCKSHCFLIIFQTQEAENSRSHSHDGSFPTFIPPPCIQLKLVQF